MQEFKHRTELISPEDHVTPKFKSGFCCADIGNIEYKCSDRPFFSVIDMLLQESKSKFVSNILEQVLNYRPSKKDYDRIQFTRHPSNENLSVVLFDNSPIGTSSIKMWYDKDNLSNRLQMTFTPIPHYEAHYQKIKTERLVPQGKSSP
ncbi:MAG: hypothetical protein WC756_17765 [Taibaiella sp.]|jgi:hypothetical protein